MHRKGGRVSRGSLFGLVLVIQQLNSIECVGEQAINQLKGGGSASTRSPLPNHTTTHTRAQTPNLTHVMKPWQRLTPNTRQCLWPVSV
jgi:hypothetical protein